MRKFICEVIQIIFWLVMIIIFMFLINHGVITQASRGYFNIRRQVVTL